MTVTRRLGIEKLENGDASAEVPLNEALDVLEAVAAGLLVLDRDLNEPAGTEVDGDALIVGSSPTGDFGDLDAGLSVAIFLNGDWFTIAAPPKGMTCFVEDEGAMLVCNGTGWVSIADYVGGLLDLKGGTNCSANPNYPAASKGDAYVVTVAGKIGGASGTSVDVGDVYVASADNAGGTQAGVGSSWFVLEHNLVGALAAANNLNDVASASTARTNLGLAIGTNVQAYDAKLAAIVALTWAADKLAYLTGTNTLATSDLTSFARTLLDDADAAAARRTLELDVSSRFHAFDDFTGGSIANSQPFAFAGLTSGAASNATVAGEASHPGICTLALGTTAGANASWAFKSMSAVLFGGGVWRHECIFRIPVASDGTDTFTARVGFGDSISNATEHTDGAFLRYTHGTNSGKFQAVTRSNGSESGSAADSGVTMSAGTWYHSVIIVNAAATSVEFYLGAAGATPTLVATNTTNIPSGAGRETSQVTGLDRNSGSSNSRTMDIDALDVRCVFSAAR